MRRTESVGQYGKIVDNGNICELARLGLTKDLPRRGGNLRLKGESGTGKTLRVHGLCDETWEENVEAWKKLGLNVPQLLKASMHEDMMYADLVAQDILVKGESQVRRQIILQWLEPPPPNTPKILLLDEANFMSPAVTGFLHSLCDWQAGMWVPELGEYVKRDPLHFLVSCDNPWERSVYTGTKQQNFAYLARFVTLEVPYMTKPQEIDWLESIYDVKQNPDLLEPIRRMVEFAHNVRKAYQQEAVTTPVTPRNELDWLNTMIRGGFDLDDVYPFIEGQFSIDEKDRIKAFWEGKSFDQVMSDLTH